MNHRLHSRTSRRGEAGPPVDASTSPFTDVTRLGLVAACLAVGAAWFAGFLGCASGVPATIEDGTDLRALAAVHTLPSGMRLIIGHDARQNVATVSLVVAAGSAQDPPGKDGLAHLVEHLTYRAAAGSVHGRDLRLASMGAVYQGETHLDYTNFYAFAHHGFWRDLTDLELGLVIDPLAGVDDSAFRSELDVVRSELWQREQTDGSARGLGWLQEAAFDRRDAYAHGGGGTPESLATLTLDDARAFARRYYQPANATLYLDGGMATDMDNLEATLPAAVVQPLPSAPAAAPAHRDHALLPSPGRLQVLRHEARVVAPELWLGWALPSVFSGDGARVALMESLASVQLGTERLYADGPEILAITVGLEKGTRGSLLFCRAQLAPGGDAEHAAGVIADHVSTLWATQIPQASTLTQRRNIVRNTALLSEESLFARARSRAVFAHFTGDQRFFLHQLAATMSHLDEFATGDFFREYLTAERAHAVFVQPSTAAADQPRATTDRAAEEEIPPSPRPFPATGPELLSASTPAPQIRILANGLTTVVVPRAGFPGATILLGFHGGTATDAPPGIAAIPPVAGVFSASDLLCGSLSRCGVLFGDHVADADSTTQGFVADRPLVSHTLDVLGQLQRVSWMEWPDGDPARRYRTRSRVSEARPDVIALSALEDALFPGQPWGRQTKVSQLEAITGAAAKAWSDGRRAARSGVVVVVGDLDGKATLDLIAEAFSSWDAGQASVMPDPSPLPPTRSVPAVLLTPWPGAPQVQVAFGCRVPAVTAATVARQDLLAQAIRDTLDQNLRRRLGATYGFAARQTTFRGGTSQILVTALVANAALPDTLAEIDTLNQNLGQGMWPRPGEKSVGDGTAAAPSPGGGDSERWGYVTRQALALDTNWALAHEIVREWNRGWTPDAGAAQLAGLRALSPAGLTTLAQTCHDSSVVSIAATPELASQVRAAKFH
jgi:zinc protease